MIKLPPNNLWSQVNDSDKFGSLFASFNLDLSTNKGLTRVSPRTKITTDDITDLGVAVGFARFNSTSLGFWTVAGSYVFKTTSADPTASFSKDAQSGTPTTCSSDTSDIIFFKSANKLVVSTQTDVYYNSGSGSWNDITGTPLTSGSPHIFAEFGSRLYVTEEFKKVYSLDTSMNLTTSGSNSFAIGTYSSGNVGLFITSILNDSSGIWILTATQQYGEVGQIIKWDGATDSVATAKYLLDCGGALTGIVKDDVLYIITTEGELLYFNGGTFSRVPNGKLPLNPVKFLKNTFSAVNDRWIHPKHGIIVTNEGKFQILINNEYEDGTFEENLPAGIWEFDLQNTSQGWTHRNSISLYTDTVNDYGQETVSRVGGLLYIKTPNKTGTFIAGAQIYSDATNTKEVIVTNDTADTIQKYGRLVTSWIWSSQIKDTWNSLYARISRLLDSNDKISVKYRTRKLSPTTITLTWTANNTFTTTTDISGKEGYEVEIIRGKGSGKTAHISTITNNAGTYTVVLDDTFNGVSSGTAKARVINFIRASDLTSQTEDYYKFPIDVTSTKIQLKVCMQFTGENEVDDFILVNTPHTEAK